jgi:hypothetical protein
LRRRSRRPAPRHALLAAVEKDKRKPQTAQPEHPNRQSVERALCDHRGWPLERCDACGHVHCANCGAVLDGVAEVLYGDVCHDCIAQCALRLDHGPGTDRDLDDELGEA